MATKNSKTAKEQLVNQAMELLSEVTNYIMEQYFMGFNGSEIADDVQRLWGFDRKHALTYVTGTLMIIESR